MRLLVLLLTGLIISATVVAEEVKPHPNERDYIIEVLVFAQQPGAGATELPSRPHLYLPIEEQALKIGTAPAWTKLSRITGPSYWPQRVKLTREATALERNNDYRLLFHQAWRMRLVSEVNSIPLLIEGGDYFVGMPELQGKLKLSVARYLHLETDLFLNTFEAVNATDYKVVSSAGMHQRRRMRSNELHFIDSPYLGLLIKIDRAP
ncbi:MAG TPA: CsiV family protein [Marinospirillum sp.]|uniref:CsiV family protein n=1 Tax=Marinospirillum sp. TaxID=2183934 RepID=UPI002B4A83F3|nr:CsiV family protein [Marinospirillum sp.]HKM15789.1 CsiV family protein [Marinospirillum sp.]